MWHMGPCYCSKDYECAKCKEDRLEYAKKHGIKPEDVTVTTIIRRVKITLTTTRSR